MEIQAELHDVYISPCLYTNIKSLSIKLFPVYEMLEKHETCSLYPVVINLMFSLYFDFQAKPCFCYYEI